MADPLPTDPNPPEQVALTLRVDAPVYQAFVQKARLAEMDVETFLASTLTIVLGCRIFNEEHACSPFLLDRRTNRP